MAYRCGTARTPPPAHTATGAPQAPQAARSAAAGGGQQVRKIKRHFRFRSFATNVEIRYKSRLTSRAPHENHTEGRADDSAPPGAPQAPQAVRSAAAGGGQQVREIKRHFRFRGFERERFLAIANTNICVCRFCHFALDTHTTDRAHVPHTHTHTHTSARSHEFTTGGAGG